MYIQMKAMKTWNLGLEKFEIERLLLKKFIVEMR